LILDFCICTSGKNVFVNNPKLLQKKKALEIERPSFYFK